MLPLITLFFVKQLSLGFCDFQTADFSQTSNLFFAASCLSKLNIEAPHNFLPAFLLIYTLTLSPIAPTHDFSCHPDNCSAPDLELPT